MYIASKEGKNECVQLLVKASADPDIGDNVSFDTSLLIIFVIESNRTMIWDITSEQHCTMFIKEKTKRKSVSHTNS